MREGQRGKQPNPVRKEGRKQESKKASKKKRERYAGNIRVLIVTGSLFSLLFAILIGYLGYFTATKEQDMINNSYNSRQEILLSRNYRGNIYSRNGEILAETVLDQEQNESRVYPYGSLFAHIVGYSTKGRTGVEALANYYLINTSTSLANKAANDVSGLKNPGDNVYTTLDVQIQQVADDQLAIYKGAIVVTEVSTGRILAMVSHPNFDPNRIQEIWDSLLEDEDSSVLFNRATQGLYPPGSTFKVITALEYMRQNPDTYDGYSFNCPGYFEADGRRISCFHGMSHGRVDFEQSLAQSCNSSFANIGLELDREAFAETLDALLFNQPLPITLSHSESRILVSDELSGSEMMQTAFGQGKTQITPLHLNMITGAIANDGVMMKPYVIDHVENDGGRVIKSFRPDSCGRLIGEEEAAVLRQMMISVVETGTAQKLSGLEYTAAGKTGSAEYNDVKEDNHAWFTGFAPAENPEVCVTIIVESCGDGGDYAVPIARRLFDAYFKGKK